MDPRRGDVDRRWLRVADLEEGMRIELTGSQNLLDFSTSPWRTFGPGTRHLVLSVQPLATGRGDRQPFDLRLEEELSGTRLFLEVADGSELVLVVEKVAGHHT